MSTTTRDASCIQALVMIQISVYSSIRLKIAKQENLSKNSHQPKFRMSAFHLNPIWEIVATESC